MISDFKQIAADFDVSGLESLKTSGSAKLGYTDVGRLVANLYTTLTIFAGIYTFINFALAGFQYITSGGDKVALEQARNKITNSLLGLAIVVSAYVVGFIAQNLFGVSLLGGVKWPTP